MSFYFRIKKAERQRGAQRKKGNPRSLPDQEEKARCCGVRDLTTRNAGGMDNGRRMWYQQKAEDRTWDSKARFTVWLRTQLCPH